MKVRIAAAAVALLALAGCTAEPPPTPAPSPSPSSSALIEVGTVVATAEFDPAQGTTGSFELVKSARGWDVRATSFSTTMPGDRWSLGMSPYPLDGDRRCLDGFAFDLGHQTAADFSIPLGEFDKFDGVGDPTFLDGVVVMAYVEQDKVDFDCYRSVLAAAPFTWNIPDLRPGLAVSDAGSTGGATGQTVEVDGTPISYTVAAGDVLAEIAARFGITVDDIAYLNPIRGTGQAETDEVINLDRTNRNGP